METFLLNKLLFFVVFFAIEAADVKKGFSSEEEAGNHQSLIACE